MLDKLEGFTRHLVGDRRDNKRRRIRYECVIRDESGVMLLRGRTRDVSGGGCCVEGLPAGHGVRHGQRVKVELLLLPRDEARIARRPIFPGYVCRVQDEGGQFVVGIQFDTAE